MTTTGSMAAADALEAELDAVLPPPSLKRVAAASLVVMALGIGGLGAWAAATPIERAVIGVGSLVAEGRRKTITLLEPGILRALLVAEGERVAAGQPLLRLDTTQAEAASNQARALYWAQAARVARLRAEQEGAREMRLPDGAAAAMADPGIAGLLESERSLLAARRAAFEGALALQRTRAAQVQEQVAAMAAPSRRSPAFPAISSAAAAFSSTASR